MRRRAAPGSAPTRQNSLFSGSYSILQAGTPSAYSVSMKMTPAIFQEISFQVAEGNPWWGLMLANEYLTSGDLLHRALRQRLSRRGGCDRLSKKVKAGLLAGARASEISPAQLASVGGRTVPRIRAIPTKFRLRHARPAVFAPSRRRRSPSASGAASRSTASPQ